MKKKRPAAGSPGRRKPAQPRVDIGILTIRVDEFQALLKVFPDKHELSFYKGPQREYVLRRVAAGAGATYTVALLRQREQGNGEAQAAARDLLEDLKPSLLLVVGIAGGLPSEDLTLGDVVLSTRIHDFSVEARKSGATAQYSATGGAIDNGLAGVVVNLPARESELGDWTKDLPKRPAVPWRKKGMLYGPPAWQRDLRQALEFHFGKGSTRDTPIQIDGPIASSDKLVKDPELLFSWITTARHLVAVEMESGGVYRAASDRCPMLAIRGISDIVGLKRCDGWTKYACASSAAFTRAFLQTQPVRPRATGKRSASAKAPVTSPPVAAVAAAGVIERLYEGTLTVEAGGNTFVDFQVTQPGILRMQAECTDKLADIHIYLGYAGCPTFDALRAGGCRVLAASQGKQPIVAMYVEDGLHVNAPQECPGSRRIYVANDGRRAGVVKLTVSLDTQQTPELARLRYLNASDDIGRALNALTGKPVKYDLPGDLAIPGIITGADDVDELNALRNARNRLKSDGSSVPTPNEWERIQWWLQRLESAAARLPEGRTMTNAGEAWARRVTHQRADASAETPTTVRRPKLVMTYSDDGRNVRPRSRTLWVENRGEADAHDVTFDELAIGGGRFSIRCDRIPFLKPGEPRHEVTCETFTRGGPPILSDRTLGEAVANTLSVHLDSLPAGEPLGGLREGGVVDQPVRCRYRDFEGCEYTTDFTVSFVWPLGKFEPVHIARPGAAAPSARPALMLVLQAHPVGQFDGLAITNVGSIAAVNLQVNPLTAGEITVRFAPVPLLRGGETRLLEVTVDEDPGRPERAGASVWRGDVRRVFQELTADWDLGRSKDEATMRVRLTCRNHQGEAFALEFDLAYNWMAEKLKQPVLVQS